MFFKPLNNLKNCRILLSNDDGIETKGINLLEKILTPLCKDIWVVAPKNEKSGAGHSITSDTRHSMLGHSSANMLPENITKISEKHYAVDGTPSDCVRAALNIIMPEKYPDLIVSGINNGRNIADDITYSGTIGVAMEGVLRGIFSIAVSQLVDEAKIVNWNLAEIYLPELIQKICKGNFSADTFININFPNIPSEELKEIVVCKHGSRRFVSGTIENKRINLNSLHGNLTSAQYPDDCLKIKDCITISALKIDLTDFSGLDELRKIIA